MIKLELAGRVTKDPQVFTTKTGGQIVSFSVAVSIVVMKESQPVFLDFKCFSPLDEIASELRKGDAVYIQAEPRTESWERDGKSHSKMIWIPYVLIPYAKDTGSSTQRASAPKTKETQTEPETQSQAKEEQDIPF